MRACSPRATRRATEGAGISRLSNLNEHRAVSNSGAPLGENDGRNARRPGVLRDRVRRDDLQRSLRLRHVSQKGQAHEPRYRGRRDERGKHKRTTRERLPHQSNIARMRIGREGLMKTVVGVIPQLNEPKVRYRRVNARAIA